MRPAATMRHIRNPKPVPSQIYRAESVTQHVWFSGPTAACREGRDEMEAHLLQKFLVHLWISLRAIERLLEEGEQDGHDNDRLERLPEDDDEDGHGEHVGSHDDGGLGDPRCDLWVRGDRRTRSRRKKAKTQRRKG